MATAVVIAGMDEIAKGVLRQEWAFTASGFSNSHNAPNYPEKTVQILGVTGGTSAVTIEGTNVTDPNADPTDWSPLHNDQDLTLGAITNTLVTSVYTIIENPLHIRARASTVSSGNTKIKVIMVSRTAV